MILLIDAGNTRIKFGWLNARGEREPQALALAHNELESQLPQWLSALPEAIHHAIGVNVAGDAMAQTIHALLQASSYDIQWIRSTPAAAGVVNGYRNPAQLGPDRWLALIGLAAHTRQHAYTPLVLAGFGTATTIDSLGPIMSSDDGTAARHFHGGLILPGVVLMRSSLVKGTANLPLAQGDTSLFPDRTVQAIATGTAAAQAGALLRQWQAVRDLCSVPPLVFVSGGAWFDIRDEVIRLFKQSGANTAIQWQPSLVLDGLAQLTPQTHDTKRNT